MQGKNMDHNDHGNMHYKHLAIMTVLSFISMYVLMYSMVDRFENVYSSFNQVYMAALMTAPMVFIEMVLMKMMYPNKKKNLAIVVSSILAGVLFFALIRFQSGVGDKQFLRSMIPHHAGAILMCKEANINDEEIKNLCSTIMQGQQKEVDQMKAILNRL
tara:strand:- start:33020 stop:33496 length:477 start_codon:yes stop_codon:yes gene_type:complete